MRQSHGVKGGAPELPYPLFSIYLVVPAKHISIYIEWKGGHNNIAVYC